MAAKSKVPARPGKAVIIYALADPRVKHPVKRFFYVGRTSRRPEARLAQHLRAARKGKGWREPRAALRYIRRLLSSGVVPTIHILEKVSFSRWEQAEMRHIARLRGLGANLMNQTLGGAGARGMKHSKLTRKKMSLAVTRRWKDPAVRAKMILGHTYSKAARRRMSMAAKGRVMSLKQRRHMAKIMTGTHPSAETLRKLRIQRRDPSHRRMMSRIAKAAWARGVYPRRKSLKQRRQIAKTMTGMHPSAETLRKLRIRWRDPSYRRMISRAMKAAWARGAYSHRKPPRH